MVSEFEEEQLVFRIDRDSGKVYPLEELRYIRDKRRYTMIVTAHEQNSNKETKTKVRKTLSKPYKSSKRLFDSILECLLATVKDYISDVKYL